MNRYFLRPFNPSLSVVKWKLMTENLTGLTRLLADQLVMVSTNFLERKVGFELRPQNAFLASPSILEKLRRELDMTEWQFTVELVG